MIQPRHLLFSLASLPLVLSQSSPSPTFDPPSASQATSTSISSQQQWSNLLGDSLYFYDIQRAGILPQDFRVKWRDGSTLQDGSDINRNLSGGSFDAGDYLKTSLPFCWTLTSISWGAITFGQGYDLSNQTDYLDQMLRWNLDWLMQAHIEPDPNKEGDLGQLVVMVGEPSRDNNYWGGDQDIPEPRPAYRVNASHTGTEVCASCAAAFASASMLYSSKTLPLSNDGSTNPTVASIRNQTYSRLLLSRAESLFQLARASPQQVYQNSVPAVNDVYPSTDTTDDLIMASVFLAAATNNQSYANLADQLYRSPPNAGQQGFGGPFPYSQNVMNWDQKSPSLPLLMTQLSLHNSTFNLDYSKYLTDSQVWLDTLISKKMFQQHFTSGGLSWWKGDSDDASLNPALNAIFLAQLTKGFVDSDKTNNYQGLIDSQLDYVLGNNPMNTAYVGGISPNSYLNPHSALASGGDDIGNVDTSPPLNEGAHVMFGAVAGGPNENDQFYDIRSDYDQTEIALDYNAPLMTLVASKIVENNDSPFYVTLNKNRIVPKKHGNGGGGLSQGAKIAIAVIVIVAFFVLVGLVCYWQRENIRWYLRRRRMGLKL